MTPRGGKSRLVRCNKRELSRASPARGAECASVHANGKALHRSYSSPEPGQQRRPRVLHVCDLALFGLIAGELRPQ
jgi:hypothetical protein